MWGLLLLISYLYCGLNETVCDWLFSSPQVCSGYRQSTMFGPPTLHTFLQEVATSNVEHYQHDSSQHGRRLFVAFTSLAEQAGVATPLYQQIHDAVHRYDFDAETPANGYRSCLHVMDVCMMSAVQVSEAVRQKREKVFFKKQHYTRAAEGASELLTSLNATLRQLVVLLSLSNGEDLYISDEHSPEFLRFADALNTAPFYGRAMGFQFCKSLQPILRQIGIAMAAYNEYYESTRWTLPKSAVSLWKGRQYANNPELRGKKLAHITKTASIDFLKSFWFLSESKVAYKMPNLVAPSIAVNKVITLHPEPLRHVTGSGREVQVPAPSAHFGPAPLNVHLYSAVKRAGMGNNASAPACSELIVHYHGGGFVAQSPRSHEIYLRDWAVKLNVPIVSVDYSLAPKAAFPRPLQDAVWAYMWARQNCQRLGSTGARIILAGDSAGANLCLTTALKCQQLDLPAPDGMFLAYFPVLLSFTPSPSRGLSFMDPMLPYGFLIRCLNAYTGPASEKEERGKDAVIEYQTKTEIISVRSQNNAKENGASEKNDVNLELTKSARFDERSLTVPRDPDLSPWWATDDAYRRLPPISVLSTHLDPCLDDCVMFARRLKRLGNDVTLDVLPGLPHGFLYFSMMSADAKAGSDLCVRRIQEKLRMRTDQS